MERGAWFVWPALDAACYGDPAAASERLALKGWRQGMTTLAAPPLGGSPAVRYLAADVTQLRTLVGLEEPLAGMAAYERAVRAAPGFPDAPRALVNSGLAALGLGLAPEAETAFARVLHEHGGSAYAAVATLGRAMALRRARRYDDARRVLEAASGLPAPAMRCAVLAERAALARATGAHAEAAALDETVARDCPRLDMLAGVPSARADSLLAIGRRDAARALLAHPAAGLEPEAQRALLVRAAELAREDGDLDAARAALDRALGLRLDAGGRLAVQGRIARLDAVTAPDRAIAALEGLAALAPSAPLRIELVGLVAETLADAGRYREALARLRLSEDASEADAEPVRARRDLVLSRWIAALDAAAAPTDVLTVYAAHRTAIDTRASGATAVRVARALGDAGLHGAALRLLRLRDTGADPVVSLGVVEAALAAGEPVVARDALARLADASLPPALAARRALAADRVAVATGELERVTAGSAAPADALLARELAMAWIARGDAALAAGSLDRAAAAYGRAAESARATPERVAAAAGLVAARGAGADRAVETLAAVDDPTVRRALALVAATRTFGAIGPVGPDRGAGVPPSREPGN